MAPVVVPAVARIKCSNPVWEPQVWVVWVNLAKNVLLKTVLHTLFFFFFWIFSSRSPKRDCVCLFYVQYLPHHQVGLAIIPKKKTFHHCNPVKETRGGPQDSCFSSFWGFFLSMWSISHGGPKSCSSCCLFGFFNTLPELPQSFILSVQNLWPIMWAPLC